MRHRLSAANVHEAMEFLRGIYGGGMTFRMLDPGERFRFTRNGPESRLMVKTSGGWFRYADEPTGPKYRTGASVPVTMEAK